MRASIRRRGIPTNTRPHVRDFLYLAVIGLIAFGTISALQGLASKVNEGLVNVKAAAMVPLRSPKVEQKIVTVPVKDDARIGKIKAFLESKNSPLSPYAQLIVEEADKYDIGWTKLVAISGMESAYCNQTVANSFNCWGLGGSRFMYFQNYEEGIKYASWLIGTQYQWNENQGIKAKYCPQIDGCNPQWAQAVTDFSNEILSLKESK
jgi:hypothetical protein